ncbi:hypothetical protein ACS4JF_05065 [Bacillus thuringiensis]|uniref:hypothetical protein n=1 Tax=Bacillus thuringiensis TaxID=1428 RepID=UPI001FAD25EA|nr:hypothetical protein [Bacillus thuringiensis]MDM8362480.1 hypothetical protein [Bacillus thuringiensis]
MTIPKQLMIGSVPYDVEVVKGWLEERENGEVRIAEVTDHEQQIKISNNVVHLCNIHWFGECYRNK